MIGERHVASLGRVLVRSAQLARVADNSFPIHTTDIIIFGHMPKYQAWVESCERNGKIVLRYANILNQPIEGWIGNPWMDWTRDNMPVMKDKQGRPAIFPWFYNPQIIDWASASEELIKKASVVLMDAVEGRGYFLDQAWHAVHGWMADPFRGPTIANCINATGMTQDEFNEQWWKHIRLFMDLLDPKRESPYTFLTNGSWTLMSAAPVYLENAHDKWDDAIKVWGAIPTKSVLAPDLTPWGQGYVNTMLKLWIWKGGYVAMDGAGNDKLEDEYYLRATRLRDGNP